MALDIPNTFGHGKIISKGQRCGPDELKEKEYIGLYFSAHWCPPCRGFTPTLVEYYRKYNSNNEGKTEIVFVSSDQNEREFNEYFAEMPWVALAFKEHHTKTMLDKKYGISGIPTLVILDNNGYLLTKNGREQVLEYLKSYKPWN